MKGDRLIARELGCSAIAVRDRRPPEFPSPGSTSAYLSGRAKERLANLSDAQRLERGRKLYATRDAAAEERRIAAARESRARRNRDLSPILAAIDWSKSDRRIAKEMGVSPGTVARRRRLQVAV